MDWWDILIALFVVGTFPLWIGPAVVVLTLAVAGILWTVTMLCLLVGAIAGICLLPFVWAWRGTRRCIDAIPTEPLLLAALIALGLVLWHAHAALLGVI